MNDLPLRRSFVTLFMFLAFTIPLEISKIWIPILRLENVGGQPASIVDIGRIIIILCVILFGMYLSLRLRFLRLARGRFLTPALLLVLYGASLLWTPARTTAVVELTRLALHTLLAYVIVWAVSSPADVRRILRSCEVIAVVLSLLCYYTVLTGNYLWNPQPGVNATVADANILGRFLLLGFFAAFFDTSVPGDSLLHGVMRLTTIILSISAVMLTGSRSSLLIAGAGVGGLILFGPREQRSAALGIGVLGGFVTVVSFIVSSFVHMRVSSLSAGVVTLGRRLMLIRAGLAMFRDHPLLGVGIGGFQSTLLGSYAEFTSYSAVPTTLSHTAIVTTMAELGLLGLGMTVAFIGATVAVFVRLARSPRRDVRGYAWACAMALVVIFASAQSEGRFLEDPYLWIFWGLLVALWRLEVEPGEDVRPEPVAAEARV